MAGIEFPTYNWEELYLETAERARAEGVASHDAWRTVVDVVLDSHEEFGEVDDEEVENIKEALYGRYQDFQRGQETM
jgi:hypothetical protein